MKLPIDILATAPAIRSSWSPRARLNVQGEQLYVSQRPACSTAASQQPGTAPEDAELEDSAVALFLQVARRVKPGFELSSDTIPHILRICQLLQGMPLGIELASAWVEVLLAG